MTIPMPVTVETAEKAKKLARLLYEDDRPVLSDPEIIEAAEDLLSSMGYPVEVYGPTKENPS